MVTSIVKGTGSCLPKRVVTNYELAEMMDTSHEWLVKRTGIHERRIAEPYELTSDLGAEAVRHALEAASMDPEDLDLIICATTTPDHTFPATATAIQSKIGMFHGAAFDVQAVCSGFLYALNVADLFIKSGQMKTVAVVGAETMTRLLNWEDRTTSVLFGDGAGALILKGEEAQNNRGVLASCLHSDGQYKDLLYTSGGASSSTDVGQIVMDGKAVFKHAVQKLSESVDEVLKKAGATPQEVDWFVPHQANDRIILSVAQKIDFPEEKIIRTIAKHANTSAASIPLALDEGVRQRKIKEGDLVLLDAMGAGFAWGASLIRW